MKGGQTKGGTRSPPLKIPWALGRVLKFERGNQKFLGALLSVGGNVKKKKKSARYKNPLRSREKPLRNNHQSVRKKATPLKKEKTFGGKGTAKKKKRFSKKNESGSAVRGPVI